MMEVNLTHLDKVYWPEEGYTKGDVIEYYHHIAPTILPYLKDRPESLNRHPHGIEGQSFFQKNFKKEVPGIHYEEFHDINYMLIQDESSLLYAANLGCIELNPFLSHFPSLDRPDFLVVDLDPADVDFNTVVEVAHEVHKLLDAIGAANYCKTSGGRGLHICVPLKAKYTQDQARQFAELICTMVHERMPDVTSIERKPTKRKNRVYLDFLQNRESQTIAAPYCIRPRPHAPVSTPLEWSEVKNGLDPKAFNIRTIFKRLEKTGDLWKPVLGKGINLQACLKVLEKTS